jgi:8-oxo-dGTP pyrophosphatase MutT (NUDIX family)
MKTVYAAGIIVYTKEKNQIRYLLLRHAAGHWGLPKGRRDPGENDEQTAQRELFEETGLTIKNLDTRFSLSTTYEVVYDNERLPKVITYFVGEVTEPIVTLSHEHDQFLWCTLEEAMETLTHESSREVLAKVHEYLQKLL